MPSAVFFDGDDSDYVGMEAYLRAWKNPSRFYTHFKTAMMDAPDKPFNGGPTPVELTGILIRHLMRQLLAKLPELQGYPQFGGNKERAEDLGMAFTVPASWGIPQQDAMRRAIALSGIKVEPNQLSFVSEPKAGCRRIAHEHERRLRKGDSIFCADMGGGTFDDAVMQFLNWHEMSPPLGDPFSGGQQFTAALAIVLCEQLKPCCSHAVSVDKGLNLVGLTDEQERETALNIWLAAEEAKIKLSTA